MKRSGLFIALAAAGLFVGGARGVLADHQDHQGARYQQSDRHAPQAVPQDARQGRGDGWRVDAGQRDKDRGQVRGDQNPFTYIRVADHAQRGTTCRPAFESGFGDRNGRAARHGDHD